VHLVGFIIGNVFDISSASFVRWKDLYCVTLLGRASRKIMYFILWTEEETVAVPKRQYENRRKMAVSRIPVQNISVFPSNCVRSLQAAEET
jgi:hypothetical protein